MLAAVEVAGAQRHVGPLDEPIVQRQDVVAGRFGKEKVLKFSQLLRVLIGQVDPLAKVLGEVVELPGILSEISRPDIDPGQPAVAAAGDPAVMIESAVAEHLEVLRVVLTWIVGVLTTESIGQTHALDWLLRHPIRHGWFGDTHHLKDRRYDIDGVMKLGTDLAAVFNALQPGDDHAIARAAEVRGDLLGPLERRIASPSPAYRVVRRSAWQPELVDAVQHLLEGRLEPIKRHDLVGGTRQRTLGARAVIADDVDDESVL